MTDLARQLGRAVVPRPLRPLGRRLAVSCGWMAEEPVGLEALAEAPFVYPFVTELLRGRTPYPQYLWGTLCAAARTRGLGYDRISVIEFGVAGGNGLVALDEIAAAVQLRSGVAIDAFGFDSGVGLPKPQDHRDLPHLWSEGWYPMDVDRLRARLGHAELRLGPIAETVPAFLDERRPPVGFVSFDVDLYSSTVEAFRLFDGPTSVLLPRIVSYFDDVIGFSHGDFIGERLAIREFNEQRGTRKVSPMYGLRYVLGFDRWWTEQMYMFHLFDHERYNDHDGFNKNRAIPLVDP